MLVPKFVSPMPNALDPSFIYQPVSGNNYDIGVYPITQKKKHHISNIYGAEMPYMQRLTDDGITIHASDVRDGFATHGCVGIPTEFAKKLFATTKLGDQVIVSNGEKLSLGAAIAAADAPPSVAR